MSITRDHWFPISPEDTEMVMLSSDMDPKSWKEAIALYDAADWTEGLREEMASLWAHNVITLILKSSFQAGQWTVKSRPYCHRKHKKQGEVIQCKV